jgi:DNA polymerase III alpha subunit
MKTDSLGIPIFTNRNLVDMIYSGHVDKCHVVLCDPSDDIEKFNAAMREQYMPELTKYIPLDVDQKEFDGALQSEWFMPDKYKTLDIGAYVTAELMSKTGIIEAYEIQETPEWNRVCEELDAFNERGMNDLLRYMVYLVDFMRENNIVWGVGRGSSIASYVLYLIGIHRIDSIKYELDWREFLR